MTILAEKNTLKIDFIVKLKAVLNENMKLNMMFSRIGKSIIQFFGCADSTYC